MSVQQTGNPEQDRSILSALQLGWLGVETFGLLRRYARHGRRAAADQVGASKRFTFTQREPNLAEQLLVSLQRLQVIAAGAAPGLPPPVPEDPPAWLEQLKADPQALDQAWADFERWSRDAWQLLLARDPLSGQAFALGGDLADTYWHAQGAGAEKLAELLRSYRLGYLAERVSDLASHLPEHAAEVLQYSLGQWGIGETVKGMKADGQERALARLESQLKVWRDLLFGLRQAGSYLTPRDRRGIAWGAGAAAAGLVALVGLATWLVVLALAGLGRGLMGSAVPLDSAKISGDVLGYVTNWQNWSALLAAASSVLAVLTGVVKGLSGWLWTFTQNVRGSLILRRIQSRTYRAPDYRREEKPSGEQA